MNRYWLVMKRNVLMNRTNSFRLYREYDLVTDKGLNLYKQSK